jgi:hypothetical protein
MTPHVTKAETPDRWPWVTWPRMLTVLGVGIALLNMGLAWLVIFQAPRAALGGDAGGRVPGAALFRAPGSSRQGPATPDETGNAMMEMIGESIRSDTFRAAREHHETVVILAFSFALLAIGFALFVMGVEGTIKIVGQRQDLGKIAVWMASPGLLCVVAAASIIGAKVFFANFDTPGRATARGIEAEARAKEVLIRAEADARQQDAWNREREADARIRIMEAEAAIKEQEALRRAQSGR